MPVPPGLPLPPMLYRGTMATALSGSLNGTVASHNRGGAYFRERIVPVDPMGPQQLLCRDAMASMAAAWNALGEPGWVQWDAYARHFTVNNRIGDAHSLSARNAFLRQVLPHAQKNAILDPTASIDPEPPPNLSLADLPTPPTFAITDARTFTISWVSSGWEALPADQGLTGIVIHLSPPRAPQQRWFRGPFRHVWWLESDEDTPPASPYEITIGSVTPTDFPDFIAGQRYFFRCRLFWELHPNGHVFQSSTLAPF